MSDNEFSFENIKDVDEVEFEELYNFINEKFKDENNETKEVKLLDSKIELRKWLSAAIKIQQQNEELKKEYLAWLKNRYLKPVEDKIEQNEKALSYIKNGIMSFMKDIKEKSVNFPDIGTVTVVSPQKSIVYPENEDELAQKLLDEKSPFVKNVPKINKAAIKEFFSQHKELPPIDGLSINDGQESIRIQKVKDKNE